jgi:hypothetical protein
VDDDKVKNLALNLTGDKTINSSNRLDESKSGLTPGRINKTMTPTTGTLDKTERKRTRTKSNDYGLAKFINNADV